MQEKITIHFEISLTPTELPVVNEWANGLALSRKLTGGLVGSSEGYF